MKKDVLELSRIIRELNKKIGKKKTVEVIFKELFCIDETTTDLQKSWELNQIQEVFDCLRPTKYQSAILKFIYKNNNAISISNLEAEFAKEGINIATGSVIGGSIAGISKKCKKLKIPNIIKIRKVQGEYNYSLIPKIRDYIGQSSDLL